MTPLPKEFLWRPFAHRALHDVNDGRPENSLAAIQAAIDAGYGIEIDVQLAADGAAMVFHDYDLGRLTPEKGPIQQRVADDLTKVRLIGGDEGIPTLQQVLSFVAGRVPILIEVKDQDGQMGRNVGRLETAVAAQLQGYDGAVAVMSFNPNSVAAMAKEIPNIPRGLTTCSYRPEYWTLLPTATRDRLRDIQDFDTVGATFISHEAGDLERDRVGALKRTGAGILCWTIKSQAEEDAARKVADNITFEGYMAEIPAYPA